MFVQVVCIVTGLIYLRAKHVFFTRGYLKNLEYLSHQIIYSMIFFLAVGNIVMHTTLYSPIYSPKLF